jgi:hypothetical protein
MLSPGSENEDKMHASRLLIPIVTMCSLAVAAAPQGSSQAKGKTPKSGDTIVVEGCLVNGMLSATEMGLASEAEDDRQPSGHTFQLKGKKDLLKDLRGKFDGHVVVVTGVLKSQLDPTPLGTTVGNTRIAVGAESTMRPPAGSTPGGTQALPVLEAKSFEGTPTTCRR